MNVWLVALIAALMLIVVLALFICWIVTRNNTGKKKQPSDLDVLDYKNGQFCEYFLNLCKLIITLSDKIRFPEGL